MSRFDLEERLIKFSLLTMGIVNKTKRSLNGVHLARQLSRSGTSVSLNYGEALGAESRRDFVHKMKVILKELRETKICLKLIAFGGLCNSTEEMKNAQRECTELILIFSKCISTAQFNDRNNRKI